MGTTRTGGKATLTINGVELGVTNWSFEEVVDPRRFIADTREMLLVQLPDTTAHLPAYMTLEFLPAEHNPAAPAGGGQ